MPQNEHFFKGNRLKIVFLGTPQFAVPILTMLAQSEYKPLAVLCAPDKPVGRKQILTPPPAKIAAQEYGLPVYQPKNKTELNHTISILSPALIISAAYGLILPKEILQTPQFGCLNIHPSLLPKYRGASPIQAAILTGDQETGVTIFKMDEGIDTGPIIKNSKFKIQNSKLTTPKLSKKLAEIGTQLLLDVLPDYLTEKITPQPQSDSQATYAPQITKENGKIDWRKSAAEIERQIRAFTPWPGSDIGLDGIKIVEAEIANNENNRQVGEVFLSDGGKLAVQTGNGCLIILKLQAAGGRPMPSNDFLRGHRQILSKILL